MKQIAKRAMSFLLSFVMVLGMLPVMEQHAHAAMTLTDTKIGLSNSNGTWSASGTSITGSVVGGSLFGQYGSKTATLTITNNHSGYVKLSFDYQVTFNERGESYLKINGTKVCTCSWEGQTITGSSGTIEMAAGAAINVELTAGKRSGNNT